MRLEWAVPTCNTIERNYGWDIIGLGIEGIQANADEVPVEVGVPAMLCWSVDPDDDLGGSTVFYYEVDGPGGRAGGDMWEAYRPPFFAPKEPGIERVYKPLEIAFTVTQEGAYIVRLGETEDLGVTRQQRYAFSLLVSYKRHDQVVRRGLE